MLPFTSLPNVLLPMTSPVSAPTFVWMEQPNNTSQGVYSQSTSRSQTLKIYSLTSNGGLGQKQPKMTFMKRAANYPLSHPCKEPSIRSFNNSTTNGHGEQDSTGDGRWLSTSVDKMDHWPSTFTFTTLSSTLMSLSGPAIEALSSQALRTRSGLHISSKMDQQFRH